MATETVTPRIPQSTQIADATGNLTQAYLMMLHDMQRAIENLQARVKSLEPPPPPIDN